MDLEIRNVGATLVSVSEGIDDSPSGRLLHVIIPELPSSTVETWQQRPSMG